MRIAFADARLPKAGTLVVGVLEGKKLSPSAVELDRRGGGSLAAAIAASRFTGKKEETLTIAAPRGLSHERVILLGLGKAEDLDAQRLRRLGGAVVPALNATGTATAAIAVDKLPGSRLDPGAAAANLAHGAMLRSYRFDKYRTKEKPEQKPSLKELTVLTAATASARRAYAPLEKVGEGVFFTRDVVSEPANIIYPESFAREALTLRKLGVKVEVLDERDMKKLGMGALLGVGQGSAKPPRLVILQWRGNPRAKNKAPVAFIGKGVTFDTGGISLKPAQGMEEMKWDMAGAGVVVGLMKALAGRKARVNAVGIAGMVENMPDGNAQRPGDIVKTMSGQTVEVLNTDAEGRLVLADALWYCQDRFKPQFMIDLATLTGAIVVALGHEYSGLFSNNDELSERLAAAGKAVEEPVWRMPLADAYDRQMDSDAADVKNIGNGRDAGSITAAQFLQRFVNDVPWAHLDIAGMAWSKKDAPLTPKGATAYGVRLLDRLVEDYYEGR
ncbi:MAG TPA: leucyl aminopeptidase [Stellaceae bacterium]|nr:leucyl aminopeptidase [Stellaceae bacterium]